MTNSNIKIEKYENLQNHCLQNDYPFLTEAGESDGEYYGGMDHSHDLFLENLSGEDLKEFNESFTDGSEGWITAYEDEYGIHHFWGDGMVSEIIVIHEIK